MNDKTISPPVRPVVSDADYSFAVNLMQYLVVPTFVLDHEGKVLIWNKACERLTGLPADEVIGTREHWQGFYDTPRPCLSDLIVQNRLEDIEALYVAHDETAGKAFGVHAENWCVMPRLGTQLYLAIDAGPIFDAQGKLLAVVETLRDMTVQKKAQLELEQLATHDGLTGIVNRRGFDEKIQAEWSRESRNQLPLSLIMVDVDHFKRFNDTYGHQMGDDCLKQLAAVLSESILRPTDLVARYGGEEFAVIMPSIDEQGAGAVAQRIAEKLAVRAIPHSGNEGVGRVTVSMGIATMTPTQSKSPDDLILLADRALYQAKKDGRNRFVIA
jgi:diguanylate cyclase (GGDEF)-like protein/PAS domain S-box-containing protein